MQKDLDNRFCYHPPTDGRIEQHEDIRSFARRYADIICAVCPEGRERALALTKLEEVTFWANAAIAREE